MPLAPMVWFKTGGSAARFVRPGSVGEVADVLGGAAADVPVLALGLGSNLIVRDGGWPGLVVRLGKALSGVRVEGLRVRAGGGAPGIAVASAARDAGIAGLEFLRGIPGTAGGAVAMNAGAYGREVADALVEATVVARGGTVEVWPRARFGFSYRHSAVPPGSVVADAVFEGVPGEPAAIGAEMERIAAAREASQPLRTRTGGSTFRNPPGAKAWELVDAAGCRGLRLGGAVVSAKHCNFLIAEDGCVSADLEALGELVRARVLERCGVALEWEIARVGLADGALPHAGAGALPRPWTGDGS